MTQKQSSRSPWAALQGVTELAVKPFGKPAVGTLTVPGSKSLTNRALLLAAVAKGTSKISGILKSDDTYWCIDALKKLGVVIDVEGDAVTIEGIHGNFLHKEASLFLGSAGTLARFLPGLLAASEGGTWHVDGSDQLCARPVADMLDAFESLGAKFTYHEQEGCLPFTVKANGLQGGDVEISGALSSQFISALMMAAPLAKAPVTIRLTEAPAQPDYLKITQEMMADFGVSMEVEGDFDVIHIQPQTYQACDMKVEADTLAACNFFGLAAVTGGEVTITNFKADSLQPGAQFLTVLQQVGCEITTGNGVTVKGPATVQGNQTFDMGNMAEATLTLAAMAPFADGPIEITNVAHIRHHECDRLSVMAAALQDSGFQTEERSDGLKIYPSNPRPATLDTHDDHRVAMALAVLGAAKKGVILKDPGCVSKTCPLFFELLKKL